MISLALRRWTVADSVGYGKPPKHTQFTKGVSGNPKGRPKGSQNLSALLEKVGRQRISVTENGRTRQLTKFEAAIIQLLNKAVRGDVKAINELRYWVQMFADSAQAALPPPLKERNDEAVMAAVIERIQRSEHTLTDEENDSPPTDQPQGDK
jgi:hypothetical protein